MWCPGLWSVVCVAMLAGCEVADPTAPLVGPERLSETGLYDDFASRKLASGIVLVTPRYPLWSDGAEKRRYLGLPEGERIDTSDMDHWRFPIGTKVWKEFSREGRLLETRLLEKRREPDEGGWFQMAYAWRDDASDALAAPLGVLDVFGTGYEIPDQHQCGQCHYRGEKPVIGISALQLSTLDPGMLSAPPSRAYAPPGDSVVREALGYLHGNCSHCHDSHSMGAPYVKVFMELAVDDARPEDTSVYRSLVGQPIHHFPERGLLGLVVPGDPEHSLVPYRMDRRDALQMPPLATHVVDVDGVATITTWIRGL